MGQWQIRGADRSSGRDVGQIYEADTRDQAESQAVKDGMLVETIELLADDNTLPNDLPTEPSTDSADSLEPMDALERQLRREAREQHGTPSARIAPLEYGNAVAQRRRGDGPVPSYAGLQIAGGVLRAFALLYYGSAILFLGIAIWALASGRTPFYPFAPNYLAVPLVLGMVGAVLHGIGAACFALRDIARNSWR